VERVLLKHLNAAMTQRELGGSASSGSLDILDRILDQVAVGLVDGYRLNDWKCIGSIGAKIAKGSGGKPCNILMRVLLNRGDQFGFVWEDIVAVFCEGIGRFSSDVLDVFNQRGNYSGRYHRDNSLFVVWTFGELTEASGCVAGIKPMITWEIVEEAFERL